MKQTFNREQERLATVVQVMKAPSERKDQLIEEYRRRSEAAFAPSTLRNYRAMVRQFSDWCVLRGVDPVPPVDPQVVASYVDDMGGRIRPTTIELRLWAISEMHRAAFLPTPCRHRLVELSLKAVKRTYGAGIRQAAPLGKKEILEVIASLGNTRIELRDKAALWVATDSWCRASEIVALRVRDLIRQPDGTSLLFIRRSKTDPYGQGAYAFLSGQGTTAVLKWVRTANLSLDDPLLTKSQSGAKRMTPMHPATLSRIIKRCTGRDDLSAHSTRVGGVQDAFRLGCDLSSIMVAGRWTSPEMPARYGRRILASQSAAAMVSEAFGSARMSNTTEVDGAQPSEQRKEERYLKRDPPSEQ